MLTPFFHYALLFECHQDYFECHEVLEEAWQEGNRSHLGYAVLIQYAVAHYHARRGNMNGAKKSIEALKQKLALASVPLEELGLDVSSFQDDLGSWPLPEILPLQQKTRDAVEALKKSFPPTDLTFDQLIHKHLYRDRSSVVEERLAAIEARKKARR